MNYFDACVRFHPDVPVACKGDPTVYENLSWPATVQVSQQELLAHQNALPEPTYLIFDLIEPWFQYKPVENINFKTDLKKDIALNKKTYKGSDARPTKAEYYWQGVLIAERTFTFETDASNLLTARREYLKYACNDGSFGEPILISEKLYEPTDMTTTDGSAVTKERMDSRAAIVDQLKAVLGGVLMQSLSIDMPTAVTTIKPWWRETKQVREEFIELGDSEWADVLLAVDLTTTPHTWLGIDMGGITVRDFIVSKLVY